MAKNRRLSPSWQLRMPLFSFWVGVIGALLASLLIHVFFLHEASYWQISSFDPRSFDTIVPRKWKLKRVDIDPQLLAEQEKQPQEEEGALASQKKASAGALAQEWDKALKFDDASLAMGKNLPTQKDPIGDSLGGEEMVQELGKDLPHDVKSDDTQALAKFLIEEGSRTSSNQPKLSLDYLASEKKIFDMNSTQKEPLKSSRSFSSSGKGEEATAEARLDQLLAQKEPLTQETAPILMPTDLLFSYDSEVLLPEAQESLEKLAQIIEKNPQAHFLIQGFTDSFGTDDYNLKLSQRRAEAMKRWLLEHHHIAATDITTQGLGKSHYLVSPQGTIEDQRLNRRVEIVIQPKSGS